MAANLTVNPMDTNILANASESTQTLPMSSLPDFEPELSRSEQRRLLTEARREKIAASIEARYQRTGRRRKEGPAMSPHLKAIAKAEAKVRRSDRKLKKKTEKAELRESIQQQKVETSLGPKKHKKRNDHESKLAWRARKAKKAKWAKESTMGLENLSEHAEGKVKASAWVDQNSEDEDTVMDGEVRGDLGFKADGEDQGTIAPEYRHVRDEHQRTLLKEAGRPARRDAQQMNELTNLFKKKFKVEDKDSGVLVSQRVGKKVARRAAAAAAQEAARVQQIGFGRDKDNAVGHSGTGGEHTIEEESMDEGEIHE